MNFLDRTTPLVACILFLVGGFFLMAFPTFILAISTATVGMILLVVGRLFLRAALPLQDKFAFTVSSVLFFAAGISFFVFLEQRVFMYLTLLGVAAVAYLYLENAYRYIHQTANYQVSSLSNVSSYMHMLSVFFATVTLFNLRFIFGVPTLTVMIVAFVFGLLLFYVYLWSQKVLLTSSRWYSVLFALLYTEMVYVLNILPHRPLVKGAVTLALVYGMMQIVLLSLRDALQPKKLFRTVGIVAFVVLIVLATAQWY